MALAVITGGATGIGAAAVRTFAADGYDVALLDINGELEPHMLMRKHMRTSNKK